MIIVWQGRGIIVPVSFLFFLLLFGMLFADANQPLLQTVAPGFAFILTGIILYIFEKKWRQAPGRIVYDKSINQEIEVKAKHTFFVVDIYYWAFICGALGLICLIILGFC